MTPREFFLNKAKRATEAAKSLRRVAGSKGLAPGTRKMLQARAEVEDKTAEQYKVLADRAIGH